MHNDDLHGFIYGDHTWCTGDCLIEVLVKEGRLSPAARDLELYENVEAIIEMEALTWAEQQDSDITPYPLVRFQVECKGEVCFGCEASLD